MMADANLRFASPPSRERSGMEIIMKNRAVTIRVWSMLAAVLLLAAGLAPLPSAAAGKTDYSAVFDADYYYNAYPDLRSAIGKDDQALLQHFISYGMSEGRNGNAEFNVEVYRNNYPDLRIAFGGDLKSYYLHYMKYGKKEGRIASGGVASTAGTVPQMNVIGSYSTTFDPAQNRARNIELAAAAIDGTVIQPGQSFSFSETVGPRTTENGFVKAPMFVNSSVVQGVGGGICQVSSTTYAAMLQCGIKATERHPHSRAVSYIPEGMDATIASGSKDLKFTNTFRYPLVIHASAANGVVTVSFGY